MTLQFTVDTLDTVPEALRDLYIEADGKYRLNVQGYEDPVGLKSALQKEREAAKTYEKQVKAWAALGKSPEDIQDLMRKQQELEDKELIDKGKLDELLTKRTERMAADNAKAIKAEQEARARAEGLAGKLSANALAKEVTDAALKAGARPEAVRHIVALASLDWRLDDNAEPAYKDAEAVGKDGKSRLSLGEWMTGFLDENPLFRPPSQGTGAPGSSGGHGHKTLRQADIDAMSPKDRAAFFAAGGRAVA